MDHDGILNLWQDLQNTLYWYSPLVMAARAGNTATLKALKKRGCKITDSWCVRVSRACFAPSSII